jgi:hypothetical protein
MDHNDRFLSLRQFRVLGAMFAFWLVTGHPTGTFAQENAQNAPGAEAAVSRVHPLAGYFTEMGLLSCVVRADQLGTFLGGRGQGQSFVVTKASDNPTLVHVSLFVPTEGGTRVADLFFTSGLSNCPASYSITTLIEGECATVIENDPAKEEYVAIGDSGSYVANIGRGASARLTPLGNGCMRVQTEVIDQ